MPRIIASSYLVRQADAMATYRICFAVDVNEPMPDLATLATVEADTPMQAVERILAEGRYPQNPDLKWARIVLTAVEGRAVHVLRVPIHAEQGPAFDWR
jgi:hypothetical protein